MAAIAIGGSKGVHSSHSPIMVLERGLAPLPRLQKELLKVRSWRSAGFYARFTCDYITNIL